MKSGYVLLRSALIVLLILGGWTTTGQAKAGKQLFDQIHMIEELAEKSEWKGAEREAKKFNKLYEKNKWKLQFLGDEAEYEGIDRKIEELKAAIKTKDKTQALVILGNIRAMLKDIYSL